ncbi:hypothetical protein MD484_g6901, partial [Candolleomyces efflorescens]
MSLVRTLIDPEGVPAQQRFADLAIVACLNNRLYLVLIAWYVAIPPVALPFLKQWPGPRREADLYSLSKCNVGSGSVAWCGVVSAPSPVPTLPYVNQRAFTNMRIHPSRSNVLTARPVAVSNWTSIASA